jgi:hypothetical protein
VRAFDADAMMVGWELVDGQQLDAAIERLFADPRAVYLHVHYAAPGCYAARIDRASGPQSVGDSARFVEREG